MCGSKDKYRQLRDLHALEVHMKDVGEKCEMTGLSTTQPFTTPITLPYDVLITLVNNKLCSYLSD